MEFTAPDDTCDPRKSFVEYSAAHIAGKPKWGGASLDGRLIQAQETVLFDVAESRR